MNELIILPEDSINRISEEASLKHALRYVGSLKAMRKATTYAIRAALEELGVVEILEVGPLDALELTGIDVHEDGPVLLRPGK